MTEPLRPLSIGELLDRIFSLYRQNFKLFIGVSILGPAAMLCCQMAFAAVGVGSAHGGMIQDRASIIATFAAGIIFYLIGHSISMAATVKAVAAVYLGKAIEIREAYASVKGSVLRVIGVVIATIVVAGLGMGCIVGVGGLIAVFATGIAPFALGHSSANAVVGGIIGAAAWVVSIIMAIAFGLRYALTVPACVVEDLGAGGALRRSRVLTKGSRKRIATVLVVCMVVFYVVFLLFAMLFQFIPMGRSLFGRQVVMQIAQLISGAFAAPLITIAMSLVYYDERVRKEAFDLQLLMESMDEERPAETWSAARKLE